MDVPSTGQIPDLASRIGRLGDRLAGARRLAHEAQLREALARNELSLALIAALTARDEALAGLRAAALDRYVARARRLPMRPPRRRLGRLTSRLPGGRERLVARAGLPAALVDEAWYRTAYPDVAASPIAPAAHYLLRGWVEGRRTHPLFDPEWYLSQAPDAAATGLSALEHYGRRGAADGLSPHPLFEVGHYLAQGADPAPGEDPLSHYLTAGWREGLSPHPLFDAAWYVGQMSAPPTAAPLVHYVTQGWREGLSPHPLFEPAWYLAHSPDLADTGIEPLQHFVAGGGGEEGRSPSPWFDAAAYIAVRGAARPAGLNPLVDYLRGGAWAVAEAQPGFATAAYLAAAPELARQGRTPLEHWARRMNAATAAQAAPLEPDQADAGSAAS